ncbi:MAG TPA: S9 family peptidase, partial [Methylomirabilota bacterium]
MPAPRYTRRRFVAGAAALGAKLSIPWRAAAQEPGSRPLVRREVLFGDPDRGWARLSHDGAWLAYIAPVDGVRNLWVAPVADLAAARPVTRATDRPIGS